MGSKAIFLLGFFLATYLLIPPEVAARELAETSNTVDTSNNKADKTNGVRDAKYPGYGGGYPGGGYGGYPGGGYGGYPRGGYGGYGGYPRGGYGGYGGYPRGGYGGYPGGGYGGYPRGGYGGYPGGGYGGYPGGGYGGHPDRYNANHAADADWQAEPKN